MFHRQSDFSKKESQRRLTPCVPGLKLSSTTLISKGWGGSVSVLASQNAQFCFGGLPADATNEGSFSLF
jgi:hypothetical protein